jgi:hypothetical protein
VGAAAGATAGWLTTPPGQALNPEDLLDPKVMPTVQAHLIEQGLRLEW